MTDTISTAIDESAPRKIHYRYDSEEVYVVQVTDPLGFTTTELKHPALGVPLLMVDANGVTTKAKYDGFGRFREATRPGTAKRQRNYAKYVENERRGLSTFDVAADGTQTWTVQDELGRLIRAGVLGFDGKWIVHRREYNAFGYPELASRPDIDAPSTYEASWTYDRLGRVLTAKTPDGGETIYKHERFSSHATDPMSHQTFVNTDRDGRVVKSGHLVDGNEYGEVSFVYGAFGQIVSVTDAEGNVTNMRYDALGRRVKFDDPDAGVSVSQYNGFSELVQETAADDAITTREYDQLGRLIHTSGPDGETIFTWDAGPHAAGRIVSSAGPDVSTTYDYDALGRLWRMSRTIDGQTYQVATNYDPYGRLKHLFYPEVSGRTRFTTRFTYNENGYLRAIDDISACHVKPEPVLAKVGDLFLDFEWLTSIRPGTSDSNFSDIRLCLARKLWKVESRSTDLALGSATLGDSILTHRSYDVASGRLEQVFVPSVGELTTYGYDADGQIRSRVDGATGRSETFSHDALHRLTHWNLSQARLHKGGPDLAGTSTVYGYDELGNLRRVTNDDAIAFSASFGSQGKPHAITWSSLDGFFSYDERGRQTTAGGRSIVYSQFDLPRRITTGAATIEFKYR